MYLRLQIIYPVTSINRSRTMKIKTRAIPINKTRTLKYSISYALGVIKLNLHNNRVLITETESIKLHETTELNISSGHYDPYSENTISRGSWYLGVRL